MQSNFFLCIFALWALLRTIYSIQTPVLNKHSSPYVYYNISNVSVSVFSNFTQNLIAPLCAIKVVYMALVKHAELNTYSMVNVLATRGWLWFPACFCRLVRLLVEFPKVKEHLFSEWSYLHQVHINLCMPDLPWVSAHEPITIQHEI
jgi:hypothetical protein